MSFVLAPREVIKSVVKATEPLDFGKTKKHEIEVHWKVLSVEQIREYQERLKEGGEKDADLLLELAVDIPGVKTPDGQELSFGVELVHQLMNIEYVRKAFSDEIADILYGKDFMKRVRAKN
ncbi:hypothetical protein ABMA58_00190 [Oceanospirillum sp. HFRX-1_2]